MKSLALSLLALVAFTVSSALAQGCGGGGCGGGDKDKTDKKKEGTKESAISCHVCL